MAVRKLTTSTIENNVWYKSMLAGNAAYNPSSFDLLETTVLSTTASSITFSSLGSYSDYKHLQLRHSVRTNTTTSGTLALRFNGDSGNNYSYQWLRGSGANVDSFGNTGQSIAHAGLVVPSDGVALNFSPTIIDILDFSNTNKTTTIRALYGVRDGAGASNEVGLSLSIWNNTAAVTSIVLTPPAGSFAAGSRFSLYGMK